jgi:hypothetical protein
LLQRREVPVAAIFITKRAEGGQLNGFAIDVLDSIYKQLNTAELGPKTVQRDTTHHGLKKPRATTDQPHGHSIYSLLQTLHPAFLVVDDLDRCGGRAYHLLEHEFSQLQRHGLRIMTTSRFSSKEGPTPRFWCDHCAPDGPFVGKPHMWDVDVHVCKMCFDEAEHDGERNEACAVCGDCRRLQRSCNKGR